MSVERENAMAKLEPEAVQYLHDHDLRTRLSIAISLKRIADSLDAGQVQGPLYNLVTDLAWHAGQAFERGKGSA